MNLPELLEEHRVPTRGHGQHHHATHGWVQVDCPYCSPGSGKFRLGLHLGGRAASCWSCGKVGPIKAVAELTGLSVGKLLSLLDLPRGEGREEPKGTFTEPPGTGPLLPAHEDYLRERGFDPEEIASVWGIKGIGVAPRLGWRIWIPVGPWSKPASWTTRSISRTSSTRYLSASPWQEGRPLKSMLYGEEKARHAVIVVEGPLDAWRIGPGAVATFGIAFTAPQAARIGRFPLRAIAFDGEEAAQRQAARLCRLLEAMPGRTVLVELEAKDPGSAGEQEIDQLREYLR